MTASLPRRTKAAIYGVAAFFFGVLVAAAFIMTAQMRDNVVADTEAQATRFVSGAEAALNRSLLSVDLLLASAGELLRGSTAATVAADASRPAAAQLMQGITRQNLLVRYVAFLNDAGEVLGSSDRRGARLAVQLPDGFLQSVLSHSASGFIVSAPSVSAVTSQRVVYFAREQRLADGLRIVAVAEVQISLLTSILTQGAEIKGLEVTLEKDAGPMLASMPPRDDLSGKPILPALDERDSDGRALRLAARLSGQPAIVVARPTLHRDLLIVASIPLETALQEWRRQRAFVLGAALLLGLMVWGVAYLTHMHLRRQWRSRATLDQALASMVDGFVLLDPQDRMLSWNQRFVDLFPWAEGVVAPLLPFQRITERGEPHIHAGGTSPAPLPAAPQAPGETELHLASGQVIVAVKSRTPDGGMVCTYHDATEKRERMADIVAGRAQLQATLDALPDVLLELGLDGVCHGFHAPRTATQARDDWPAPVGRSLRELLPPDAAAEVLAAMQETYGAGASAGRQFARRSAAGTTWFEISVARKSVGEGADARFIVLLRDVTERKSAAREIEHLAFYDGLTGLPNRHLLLHRLKEAVETNQRRRRGGALLFLDLDDFKTLNDAHGHAIGNHLLKRVAMRLLGVMRDGDTVARLGGDEFVILLEGLHEDAAVAAMQTKAAGESILAEIQQTFELGSHRYHGTCSIGATLFSGEVASLEDLLKQADIAMYAAKTAGGNALRFFEAAMQTTITARATLESELHAALAARQFTLHFQRQVAARDRVVGAEVLIRWRHPHRGLLPPAGFIELAEETGLIVPIGLWVLEQACLQLESWSHDPRRSHLELSVNVSARQFRNDDFDEQVRGVLIRTGANPRRLKLELTESLLHDKLPETIRKMKSLAAIGIQFSMDDFGIGYSSLSYMAQLPFHQVKIDKFFVQGIGSNPKIELLIQTIIGMARSLDLGVVAEGVETEAQLRFLEQHGCTLCQGFLFGQPVPIDEFDGQLPNVVTA